MGRIVSGTMPEIMRVAHQYLFYRHQEAAAKRAKEKVVKGADGSHLLKDYIAANGEPTDAGHIDWLFEHPLNIGGDVFRGLRNQMTQPDPELDEGRAEELLTKLGLRDRVIKEVTVEVADWDELYVLYQQGLITEEQLDSLFDIPDPTWSLVVIK